jgi:hypothetical protein
MDNWAGYATTILAFAIPVVLLPIIGRQRKIDKSTRYMLILALAVIGLWCVFYPLMFYPGYLSSGSPGGAIADQPWFRLAAGVVITAIGVLGAFSWVRGTEAKAAASSKPPISAVRTKVEDNNQECKLCKDGSMPRLVELPTFSGQIGNFPPQGWEAHPWQLPTILTFSGLHTYSCPDEDGFRPPSDRFASDLFKEILENRALPLTVPFIDTTNHLEPGYLIWPDRLFCSVCNEALIDNPNLKAIQGKTEHGTIEGEIHLPYIPPFRLKYEGETIICPNCHTVLLIDYYFNRTDVSEAIDKALKNANIKRGFSGLVDQLREPGILR